MTDEQINQRIAEACGWTEITNCTCGGRKRGCPPGAHFSSHTPNYCADLNAMHEAEKVLIAGFEDEPESSEPWSDYQTNLIIACPAYLSYHATARQRAEAFLRTMGKWEEVQG